MMLEKKVMNQKRQLLVFNTTANPGSENEESDESDKEYGNMKHYTLKNKGESKLPKKAWHGTPQSIDYGELVDSCISLAKIRYQLRQRSEERRG